MANLPKFTDADFRADGVGLDFDLSKVYDIPAIEGLIFSYANFDKCRKEIIRYEEKRNTNSMKAIQPKESKKEALALLRCHS